MVLSGLYFRACGLGGVRGPPRCANLCTSNAIELNHAKEQGGCRTIQPRNIRDSAFLEKQGSGKGASILPDAGRS